MIFDMVIAIGYCCLWIYGKIFTFAKYLNWI